MISNPGSTRNLGAPLPAPPGVPHEAPLSPQALREALRRFAADGIDTLVVAGGDGTVRELMSALPESYGATPLPALLLLKSGNSNVIAGDVGGIGHDRRQLDSALSRLAQGGLRETLRAPLEVRWPDGSRPPMRGMVAGAGAFERATHYARERMMAKGVRHRALIAGALATALLQAARGVSPWADGASLHLTRDGDDALHGARFLLLATALERLTMGIWPFWDGDGAAGMRFLDVDARPPAFARAIWPMLRGRPTAAMRRSGAYRSGRARSLRLQLDEGALVIDGESFAPDGDGRLDIGLAPPMRFLHP